MAGPCVLYNGKKYTREEFAALIHDGELSNLISSNKLDPKKLTGEIPADFKIEIPEPKEMSVITPEKSSNYANLTQNENGDFVFFHIGDTGYDTIKPASGVGTKTSREEASALSKVGGLAMYYTTPSDSETMVSGPAKYAVTVPKEKVYDFNTDENNYYDEAKKRHEEEYPGKAFDANSQLAYITKIAGENGYDMVVAEWNGRTRAQSTKELTPTDVQLSEGQRVTKTFDNKYVPNTEKGYVSVVPESKESKFQKIYDKIYNDRNSKQIYDELYRLSTSKLSREEVTNLVNESDLPQELKDEYNKVANQREEKRRSYFKTETVNVEGAPEGAYINVGMETGVKGENITVEEIKDALPEDVEVLEETIKDVVSEKDGKESKEPTSVMKLSRPLTDTEMQKLLVATEQMGIAQLVDGEGTLHGTNEWGDFDPKFFYMPDGRSLDKFISGEKTVEQEVDEISKMFSTDIDKAVENAKSALSKILPNVNIVVHDNYDSYTKAVGEEDVESGGTYTTKTNTIHINKRAATKTTVAHEVFHAVLLNMVGSDAKAADVTKRMINALSKQLDNNPDLKEYLENFVASYDENIKNEEKAAELLGYLAANYEALPKQSQSLIKRWMDALAKLFGFKPFTDNEVVDFFNTLSEKVATGQEVTQSDVKVLESGKKIKSPISLLQRKQVGDFDVKYTEQEKIEELKKNGLVTEPENTDFMSGNSVAITSPDDMLVGSISIDGKQIFEGGGGVFFVTKYGDVWASGNEGTANTLAGAINKSLENNENKKGYLVLTKGTDSKLISSVSGVNSSLSILETMLDKGFVSLSDFRKAVSESVKKEVFNISVNEQIKKYKKENNLSKNDKIPTSEMQSIKEKAKKVSESSKGFIKLSSESKQLKTDIEKYFSDPSTSTFETRGNVIKDLIGRLSQSKSTKENSKKIINLLGGDANKGLGKDKTKTLESFADLIAGVASERLTKGLKVGDVYAIIEVNGKVKVKEDSHPSYPFHIVQVDGKKPILHLPKVRENGSKTITTSTGKPYSVGQVSIMSGTFNEPSDRKQTSVISNKIKAAKKAGFSDAAISQYLQNNGYTAEQASEAILKYNSQQIKKAQAEDGIFVTEGNSKIKNFLGAVRRKLLSARGFYPKSIFSAIEQKRANIEKQSKMVAYTSSKFDKAVKNYNGDKDQLIKDFDAYIRGDKSVSLPTEFKVLGDIMRNQIDGLTQQLINAGGIAPESIENIRTNIGSYLTRAYEVFDNKNWDKKVKEDVVENARQYLRNSLAKIAEDRSKNTGVTKEDVLNKLVEEEINKIIKRDVASSFINSGKEGSKDLSILKQKMDIPMEIRALMGEYTDPIQNYANTIYKMATLVENTKFLNDIKNNGLGTIFFEENDINRPKDFNVKIAADSTKTFDPLGGLFTSKEIKEAFENIDKVSGLAGALNKFAGYKFYMKTLATVKWLKTIGSVATHGKNVFGNLDFMLSNGYLDFSEYGKSFDVIRNDFFNKGKKNLEDKMLEYIEAGIVDQGVALSEIKSLFKDGSFDKTFERRMNNQDDNKALKFLKNVKKYGSSFIKNAENAYQAEDDFFKIVAYETEKRRYAEAFYNKPFDQLTDTEKNDVRDYVSEIVKNTLPNYSRIPNSAKLLKVVPVAGTFISFQLEALRTTYNSVSLAFTEMKSDNPKVRAIGAKRFAAMTLTQGLKYGLMYLLALNRSGGDDDDEDNVNKKAKRFVAPWSKNSNIVITDMGDGKFSFIDFSASDPRAAMPKALNAFSSGDNFVDGLIKSIEELTSPYINEDILLSLGTDLYNNEDAFGREIYNKYDSSTDKINKIFNRVWKTFEPGTVTSIKKISESENKVNDAIGQFTGYKTIDVDIEKNYYFKSKESFDNVLQAKQIYNKAFRKFEKGEITKDELYEYYNQANESVKKILEDSKKDFDAAVYFGANPDVLSQTADDAGFSKSMVSQIESGEFEDIEDKAPITQEEAMKRLEKARQKIREIDFSEIRRKRREGN